MIELAVARQIAAPAPPHSRHFDAPRWWPEWIRAILAEERPASATLQASKAAATPPATPFAPAAAALHEALQDAQDADSGGDAGAGAGAGEDLWSLAAAQHRVHLARRTLRSLLDAELGCGPGTRLEWCACSESPAAR